MQVAVDFVVAQDSYAQQQQAEEAQAQKEKAEFLAKGLTHAAEGGHWVCPMVDAGNAFCPGDRYWSCCGSMDKDSTLCSYKYDTSPDIVPFDQRYSGHTWPIMRCCCCYYLCYCCMSCIRMLN